jgi:hypothetical protein
VTAARIMTERTVCPGEPIRNFTAFRGAAHLLRNLTATGLMTRGIQQENDVSRYVQYPRPRCPKCRKNYGYSRDWHLCGLGFDLREIGRTERYVVVHCQWCKYVWRSRNAAALGGVLTKENT